MEIFNLLTKIFTGVIIVTVIVGLILLVFGLYIKKKKPGKEKEQDYKYTNFRRENSKSYVPFDDIRDGVIIFDNYTRFVSAIVCRGYDFFSAHPAEQMATSQAYVEFINTIDKPIQKRIYSKKVDLDSSINNHKTVIDEIDHKLLAMYNEGIALEAEIKKAEKERKELLKLEAEKLYNEVKQMEWKKKHMLHVLQYIENMSGEGAAPVQEETYLFEWIFNSSDFPDNISNEEILARAQKELDSKSNQMKASLSKCGVRARRATHEEILDIARRHFHPIGADIYKMRDIENSNFDSMVVSARTLEDAERRFNEALRAEVAAALYDGQQLT